VYTTTLSINSYYTSYRLPSNKVFQHRTFAGALTTDHRYLWQVELHVHAQLGERILQLVHDGYQLFHAHVAGHRAAGMATAAAAAAAATATATTDELEEVCRLKEVFADQVFDHGATTNAESTTATATTTKRGCDDHDARAQTTTHDPLDNTSPLTTAAAAKHTDGNDRSYGYGRL